jgi:membrane protein
VSPRALTRAKAGASARWNELKRRRPAAAHVASAWKLLQDNNGSQYAAAITYFSFLALFPLLLLAVAVTGFVLHSHPAAQQSLLDHITANVPGDLGATLQSSVRRAINARTSLGIVGLVGVLITGLGWIGNLRAAIDGVWGRRPAKRNFFAAKLANLLVLAGLGLGIIISLGLTVVGTAVTDQVLNAVGLDDVGGMPSFVTILGILLGTLGDVVIFWWILGRMPGMGVPPRVGVQGAVLAAVGFEVLKVVGTVTIAKTAHSPTLGPFAGLLAVLIWIQLVARFMLFCAAWTATCRGCPLGPPEPKALALVDDAEAAPAADRDEAPASPLVVAGSLIGAGAVLGAAAVTWLRSRRRGPTDLDHPAS